MEDKTKITIEVEVVSPERAAQFLAMNTHNRTIHHMAVNFYAMQMKEGKWRPNVGQPIIFAEDGTLLDGQHRLEAIIKAGVSVKMAILRGADKEDFLVLDTGLRRTGADVLAITDVPNARNVCAVIHSYWALRRSGSMGRRPESLASMGYTNEDVLAEYRATPDFYHSIIKEAQRIYNQCRFLPTSEFGAIFCPAC